MPGFDFANAKLTNWDIPMASHLLFMHEAVWDNAKFLAHFYLLDGYTRTSRLFRFYRLTCMPEFVVLVRDESFAMTLWQRCNDLGLTGEGHLIVEDSDWVNSFKQHEPYGDSQSPAKLIHYVVCCGNDFVHLLSKDCPQIANLGIVEDDGLKNRPNCLMVARERMDAIVH
jgi:hypothetical protein